jgi:hypothetical protein
MIAGYVNPSKFLHPLLDGYALGVFARMLGHATREARDRAGEIGGPVKFAEPTYGLVEKAWFDASELARQLDFYDAEAESWDVPSVEAGLKKLVQANLLEEHDDHWVVMFDEVGGGDRLL